MSSLSAKPEIEKHLRECCEELLAWHRQGVLPRGHVMRIAEEHLYGDAYLVERQVAEAAFKHIVENHEQKN